MPSRYKGDLTLVAAAYNAGVGSVQRFGGVPPYSETQAYVEKVQTLYARYRVALDKPAGARRPDHCTVKYAACGVPTRPLASFPCTNTTCRPGARPVVESCTVADSVA